MTLHTDGVIASAINHIGCVGEIFRSAGFKSFTGTTVEGFGIGSTVGEIVAVYGEPAKRWSDDRTTSKIPVQVTLFYPYLGIQFSYYGAQDPDMDGSQRVFSIFLSQRRVKAVVDDREDGG